MPTKTLPKTLLSVLGTRPEAIKMAPVVRALARCKEIRSVLCVTGQHREMLAQALSCFDLTPDYDLKIMQPSQNLSDITHRVLVGMEKIFTKTPCDGVLVHGDTTTALAAALAAFYKKIPVGHVEAGLRTHNPLLPWPEEMNRQLISRLCSWHFAPTSQNRKNLLQENVPKKSITITGNTVIDALYHTAQNLKKPAHAKAVRTKLANQGCVWDDSQKVILVTGHRRENFGKPLKNICQALKKLSEDEQLFLVYPIHLNPHVREVVGAKLRGRPNIVLPKPLDYQCFVYLMMHCFLVLTDSGGIQEEAPAFDKPVLVMRDVTERPEALEAGTVALVGSETRRIVSEVRRLLCDGAAYAKMAQAPNPYGDGVAAVKIVKVLKDVL